MAYTGSSGSGETFPVTDHSLIRKAILEDPKGQREALSRLLQLYCGKLKRILNYRFRLGDDRTEELLQDFIADKILGGEILHRYKQDQGRFRSWLLTSLEHYAIDCSRRAQAQRRFDGNHLSLDTEDQAAWVVDRGVEPDLLLQLCWARQVCGRALRRMKRECEARSQDRIWAVYKICELRPTLTKAQKPDYTQVVARFGFASPSQAYNTRITALRKAAQHFREVIREDYGYDQQGIEQELRELRDVFARSVALSDLWFAINRQPRNVNSKPVHPGQ